ncbi:MAG: glycoside hydrolase family 15 protein [Trueperaceae bacterium]|nr:glycoside hydrolase family 15 protein [Trueperaceae bacterium]
MEVTLLGRLEPYYQQVNTVILDRQNPVTGLLPASTAVNIHGDYTDAWVRDNVYSVLAVWGLGLAYRKLDHDGGRSYELEHATVKLMRGLLFAMMKQAPKVEAFKRSQSPLDALHAKYDTGSGDVVVGDDAWGHLQIDATSLFLLQLAQMTASGLRIVYTLDEVNFVQNLVYYVSRAYRTPDYGIWERGDKINRGQPEINVSSVAMAKAALEALSGFNLFGVRGSQASVIHVFPDEIARARITTESLLPRESSSKEVDAALLSVIGYPAFAVEDAALVEHTRQTIVDKLEGRYGLKRFLRDGHQTVLEDISRLYYEPQELKQFEHIESEWPLFFCYLFLDGLSRNDRAQSEEYYHKLQPLLVGSRGRRPDDPAAARLLPELYFVSEASIEAEKRQPGSQVRQPNDNLPLVWAQSLYLLGQLLRDDLLHISDIDPLGRRLNVGKERQPVVQIALLAEDAALQAELEAYNVATETPQQVQGVSLRRGRDLSAALHQVGRNDKLGLSGRPLRRIRSLASSRIFQLRGETVVCLPAFFDPQQFYLMLDPEFLVARLRGELAYIHRNWAEPGRPTVTLLLTRTMFDTGREPLLALMHELRSGHCNGVPVRLGRLQQLLQAASFERIDNLHDFRFSQAPLDRAETPTRALRFSPDAQRPLRNDEELELEVQTEDRVLVARLAASVNLYEQVEVLDLLVRRHGLGTPITLGGHAVQLRALLGEVYSRAGDLQLWAVLRRSAALLGRDDIELLNAVTDILVRQKHILIGKAYSEASLITTPLPYKDLIDKIRAFCREDIRDRALTQEVLLYLGSLIKAEPQLFEGVLTLRVGYLILLLTGELAREQALSQDEAYERLMQLSPSEVRQRLYRVLGGYRNAGQMVQQQESLSARAPQRGIRWLARSEAEPRETPPEGWWRWRQRQGTLHRVDPDFYPRVWALLEHCKGLIIGDKLERRNRLDSNILLSEMTPGEANFARRVEHLLNKIASPEYRQLSLETLAVLLELTERNPELQIEEYLVLDVIIGHAVRLAWLQRNPAQAPDYNQNKANAWAEFYELSPSEAKRQLVDAFRYLLDFGDAAATAESVV